ncbi:MAG: GyrI-like domain-containing protein [Promethearchaeota archaeon]|jgi:effector-binding domain-containing protein
MDEITIENIPNQKVIGMRKKGRYQELIPGMLQQLFPYIKKFENDVFCGPPMFICHETSVEEVMEADKTDTADVEVAIPISRNIDETDEMKIYNLPGGKMAKIVHKGPYDKMDQIYKKLFKWIELNGKIITGPTREVYLIDTNEVGMEETLTEIYATI